MKRRAARSLSCSIRAVCLSSRLNNAFSATNARDRAGWQHRGHLWTLPLTVFALLPTSCNKASWRLLSCSFFAMLSFASFNLRSSCLIVRSYHQRACSILSLSDWGSRFGYQLTNGRLRRIAIIYESACRIESEPATERHERPDANLQLATAPPIRMTALGHAHSGWW